MTRRKKLVTITYRKEKRNHRNGGNASSFLEKCYALSQLCKHEINTSQEHSQISNKRNELKTKQRCTEKERKRRDKKVQENKSNKEKQSSQRVFDL